MRIRWIIDWPVIKTPLLATGKDAARYGSYADNFILFIHGFDSKVCHRFAECCD